MKLTKFETHSVNTGDLRAMKQFDICIQIFSYQISLVYVLHMKYCNY